MNEVGNGSRHTPMEYLRCWIHRPAVYVLFILPSACRISARLFIFAPIFSGLHTACPTDRLQAVFFFSSNPMFFIPLMKISLMILSNSSLGISFCSTHFPSIFTRFTHVNAIEPSPLLFHNLEFIFLLCASLTCYPTFSASRCTFRWSATLAAFQQLFHFAS